MSENITVVYEKGVLRPLSPLNLPERTQLKIRIVQADEDQTAEAEKAYRVLLQAGLIRPSVAIEGTPVSENERRRAADAYGEAGPLSDLIIAERDELFLSADSRLLAVSAEIGLSSENPNDRP